MTSNKLNFLKIYHYNIIKIVKNRQNFRKNLDKFSNLLYVKHLKYYVYEFLIFKL